jgi:hypothetical protein
MCVHLGIDLFFVCIYLPRLERRELAAGVVTSSAVVITTSAALRAVFTIHAVWWGICASCVTWGGARDRQRKRAEGGRGNGQERVRARIRQHDAEREGGVGRERRERPRDNRQTQE